MRPTAPIFALVLVLAAAPAIAGDDDDTSLDDIPHVTFVGSAQAEMAPDVATITLGVKTEKPTAKAAADETARIASEVVGAAKAQGVAAADVSTLSVTLQQTFDDIHDPQGQIAGRRPRGYAADNVIAVRSHDLARVGALAQGLIDKGANRFDGIAFSIAHPEPVQVRLTAEAVKDARSHAEAAATAAGARLGRVLLIERPGGEADGAVRPLAIRVGAAAPAMPVEAGTTTLVSSVSVTWALDAN